MDICLILHNIRSLYNVGSIFRTADGFGVKKIYLTGYTPAPYDIFGKLRKDFSKTALGAEKFVEWEKVEASLPSRHGGITAKAVKNIGGLIKTLKKEKIFIVSLEQSKNSVPLDRFFGFAKKAPRKNSFFSPSLRRRGLGGGLLMVYKKQTYKGMAMILGNEVRGIPKSILKKSDAIVEIPMRGKKESFNVAVAAGIALYAIRF